jgi:hypothetical protein
VKEAFSSGERIVDGKESKGENYLAARLSDDSIRYLPFPKLAVCPYA